MPDNNKPKAIGGIKQNTSKTPSRQKGINYLFAIAINKYVHAPQLGNCLKDAEDFISLLTERYQFSNKNVIRLFDEQATLPNIYNQLKELSKKIKANDSLIIYFSGHGYMDRSDKSGHLVPVEGGKDAVWTYMSNDNLLSRIRAIKSFHTFLIIDSCFSGTLFMNKSMDSTALAEEVGRYPSRWGLAAGRIEEVADGYHGENSPFAKAVLSFLKTNSSAKFPVSELIQYVKKVTPRNSDQTPIGGPIFKAGDMDGEFIFELQNSETFIGNKNTTTTPTPVVITPTITNTSPPTSFLQKNGKYLLLLLLIPFLIWGISNWSSTPKQQDTSTTPTPIETPNTNLKNNSTDQTPSSSNDANPTTNQLELTYKWKKDQINAKITGGKPPYRISLKKDNQEKYHQTILQAGQHNITITKAFREDAGKYQLIVKDANESRQQQTIAIDPPKVILKKRGTFSDSRNGKTYKWVLNDGKKWMSENLNIKTTNSWCFENDNQNCKKYGRLYTWDDAMKACPKGWRLPSESDWWKLTSQFGKAYSKKRGFTNREAGKNIFEHFTKNGDTGLSIQLGGYRYSSGKFPEKQLETGGKYWSSTEENSDKAIIYDFSKNGHVSGGSHVGSGGSNKQTAVSCRCIQD